MLTVGANLFVLTAVVLAVAGRVSPAAADSRDRFRESFAGSALPFAWVVALVSLGGSLYYSEVAGFVPCKLCWYQRTMMYPLAIILGIAALRRDGGIRRYVLPMVAVGALVSVYHYQLERFPSQSSPACLADAPCTVTWVWQFHYISLPFMALSAFALIATLLRLAPDDGAAAAGGRVEQASLFDAAGGTGDDAEGGSF
ncbi:MAG: disulfide bond formation protein B [Acidobacteria bacterium]|nr:disulfide bond formation protein B [Acidobacteriota bacterium]